VIIDERKRRLAEIPLCLVGADGTKLEQTTDSTGTARWDEVPSEQTWQLTCTEQPGDMQRGATLGLVKFVENTEPEAASEEELANALPEEELDDEEEEDSAPVVGGGLGGSLSGGAKNAANSAGGGLLGAVGKVVTDVVDALSGAVKVDVSAGASAAGGTAGSIGSFDTTFGDASESDADDDAVEDADREYPPGFDPQAGPTLSFVANVERVKVKNGDSLESLASAANLSANQLTLFNWGTDDPAEIQRKLRWETGCATDGDYADDLQLDDYADPGVIYVPRALGLPVEIGKRYKLLGKSVQPFFLVLKNGVGRPIPAAAYTLDFADGRRKSGTLGEHGVGLIENPQWGDVQVHYDDPGDVRAKALAGDARQAIQEIDVAALYQIMSTHSEELRALIDAYEQYFNDFSGDGFVADVNAIVTDENERLGVDILLDEVGGRLLG
jgi:hypothetical protein